MSDINGTGYGSKHNWRRGATSSGKCTKYECRSCGYPFWHYYDRVPDIFSAMKREKVPEHCTVTKEKNDE